MRKRFFPKLYEIGLNYPKTVLLFFFVCVLFSLWHARHLKLIIDLISLLPKNAESVQTLEEFKKLFGSNHYFLITIEAPHAALAEKYADLLSREIEAFPEVIYVDYKRPIGFFKERQWLYLDTPDLLEMERRIDRVLDLEKKGVSLFFNKYMDFADAEDRPDLSFSDILEKYQKKTWSTQEASISDDGGRFLAIRIKVADLAAGYEASQKFTKNLKGIERDLKKNPEFHAISIGYTGTLQINNDESDAIKKQMALVSVIVIIVLFLILYAYFRTFESILLIGLPLVVGVLCTGGMITAFLGHLNIFTSFAAAIIAGLGSDYGIYLLNRYYSERENGQPFMLSCQLTFGQTGIATTMSMLTTVGTFVALMASKFGFFFEFGVAGAVGILVNYLAMMLIMPSLLVLRHGGLKPSRLARRAPWNVFLLPSQNLLKKKLGFLFMSAPRVSVLFGFLICGVCLLAVPSQSKIIYRDGLLENPNLPSRQLLKRISKSVQTTFNPTFLMTSSQKDEAETVQVLSERLQKSSLGSQVYKGVLGLSSFVPEDQISKKEIFRRMVQKISKIRWLPGTQKNDTLENLHQSIKAPLITRDALPLEIKRYFESPADPHQSVVYLYPAFGRTSSEALKRYHEGVLQLKKETGLYFVPVDTNFASDDVFTLIQKEAPKLLFLTLLFLAMVILFLSRSFKRTLIIIANLGGSLVVLMGVLWLYRVELNVMNIVTFPIILGTGIDCFIHFAKRYDESRDMILTLKEKILAIIVSNVTSLVGFAGLFLTSSSGLRSIGLVAVLGLLIVTLFCVFLFPRCLMLGSLKKRES